MGASRKLTQCYIDGVNPSYIIKGWLVHMGSVLKRGASISVKFRGFKRGFPAIHGRMRN